MERSVLKEKKQKLRKDNNLDEGKTNICSLPAVIIQLILSFLTTKDAVKTSILSKTWEKHWMALPYLHFEEHEVAGDRGMFLDFVDRVLLLREKSKIKKFVLFCDVIFDGPRINNWISTALKHEVQELCLEFYYVVEPLILPHALFTCDSLTELTLRLDYKYLLLPAVISFSALKILKFQDVVFREGVQGLFSACPVLEVLTIHDCCWREVKAVRIAPPSLKVISIRDIDDKDDDCHVVIAGSRLESFSFRGIIQNDYVVNSSSLVDASVHLDIPYLEIRDFGVEDDWIFGKLANRVLALLRGLSSVKSLRLSNHFLLVQRDMDWAEEISRIPVFCNLTNLKLCSNMRNWFRLEYGVALCNILQRFPLLSSLDVEKGFTPSEVNFVLNPVPSCFSSHLKLLRIGRYHDSCEGHCTCRQVLMTLLQHATVLDKIIICFNSVENKMMAQEELLTLPRAPNCEMVLTVE